MGAPSRAWRLLAVVVMVCFGCGASAQTMPSEQGFWFVPEGTVAYWIVDGKVMGEDERTQALMAAGLRGLMDSVISVEGASSAADALLRGKILAGASYKVCLLELEGQAVPARDKRAARVFRPTKFGAVIDIRAKKETHDRFNAAMEGAISTDGKGGPSRQRKELDLPGGLKGQLSVSEDDWRNVAWVSTPDAFIVGFGKGALEKWMSAKAGNARVAAWGLQRNLIYQKRAKGVRAFEAFVDLNALRQSVPEEFAAGRLGPLAHAWHVQNDRTLMVHGTLPGKGDAAKGDSAADAAGVPLLAIDVTWSDRAEKPGQWKSVSVSEGAWPAGVARPSSGAWAILMRPTVLSWVNVGAETYQELGGGIEFSALQSRWERRMQPVLEKVVPRIGDWVMVAPGLDVTVGLKPAEGAAAAGPDKLASDLRALFSSLEPFVGFAGKAWSLKVDAEDELKGFGWRVAEDGKAMMGSWERGKK